MIDSRELLEDPPRILGLLCSALEIPFTDNLLSWPPGPRATDGIWADHWYKEVMITTSFGPYRPKSDPIPDQLGDIFARCKEIYQELFEYRLR
ncbi:MAG: hypothetical protein ABGX16_14470 [Pirellulales bacterium]